MNRRMLARSVMVATGGLVATALPSSIAFAGDTAEPVDPTTPPDAAAALATPAPVTATSSVTLPLFGAPLTVDISTGPGGALAVVNVTPSDSLTASTDRPQKVAFVNADGTAKVIVRAHDGGQRIEARAGTLADVQGPGGWSGDVFGTGAITTVGFDVVTDADGKPSLTNIVSSDPTAVIGAVELDDRGDDSVAHALVTFTNGIERRYLWIAVRSDTNGERQYATVSVSLSQVKGARVELAQLVGPQVWTGALCDGSPVSVAYTINADGTIAPDPVATPAGDVKVEGRWLKVRFSEREAVQIAVRGDEAESRISVHDHMRCDFGPPEVNTTVEPGATDPWQGRGWDHHDGRDDDQHRGDRDGERGQRGDRDHRGDDHDGDGGRTDDGHRDSGD